MIFDIRKLFKNDCQVGRFEYLKITSALVLLISLIGIFICSISPNLTDSIFYPLAAAGFLILFVLNVIFWIITYKRLLNIFNNIPAVIIFFIIFLGLCVSKGLCIELNYDLNIYINTAISLLKLLFAGVLFLVPGKQQSDKLFSNTIFFIIFPIALILFIAIKIFPPITTISGSSMNDTILSGDKVVINPFDRNFKRGDIVLLKYKNRMYLKRIVGLPYENIDIKDNQVYINDDLLAEDYISTKYPPFPCKQDMYCHVLPIPKNNYFLLGDSRGNSYDSRFFGPIPKYKIKGRVVHIFYPFERRQTVDRYHYSHATTESYMREMQNTIKSLWQPPVCSKNATVKTSFTIKRNGEIVNPTIKESSGNEVLDKSAINTLKKLKKLSPLPKDLQHLDHVDVEFKFDYNVKKR